MPGQEPSSLCTCVEVSNLVTPKDELGSHMCTILAGKREGMTDFNCTNARELGKEALCPSSLSLACITSEGIPGPLAVCICERSSDCPDDQICVKDPVKQPGLGAGICIPHTP